MVAREKEIVSPKMNNEWKNKTALITGASSGIGASVAKLLATKGITVLLVARRLDKLESLAQAIRLSGGDASTFAADLSKESDRLCLVNQVLEKVGVPDILVNNAGIGWYGYFTEMSWSTASELLRLNIEGTTHLTSLLLPEMLKKPRARIINIGSIIGKLPEQGVALYSASKGYLDNFTKSLYRELRGTGTTISVLRPGPVKTEFFDRAESYPNGGRVPAEGVAVSSDRVARAVWFLIEHPRRFFYVPFYVALSPLLELLFSWAIDLVGPILLVVRDKKRIK